MAFKKRASGRSFGNINDCWAIFLRFLGDPWALFESLPTVAIVWEIVHVLLT